MDAKDLLPGYEQTLPVLSRPSAAAWAADPIHSPYAAPIHFDPNIHPIQTMASTPAPAPAPAPAPPPPKASSRKTTTRVRKPRKADNASTGKSTLFWVNSDQQTAAAGTTDETLKRIRSHVMSEHNRKKRMGNGEQSNKSKWKNSPCQPTTTTNTGALDTAGPVGSCIGSSVNLSSSQISDEQELEQVEELVTSTAVGYPAMQAASWNDSGFGGAVAYPSAWSYLGQGANDPFHTGHTHLTDRMMRHLRVFLWDLTQEAHPLQTRYKPKLQAHWASLIQRDPAILHATICMATSNDAMRAGELPIRDPNQKRSQLVIDTFHHRGETIRLVNEGLSDPVKASSDVLIAAVSTLLTIEIASGNPDYLKIHLAGLRQMIALRKNFDDVPSDVRFQISWTDIRVACMAHAKPIFPFVRYTRPARLSLIPPNDDVALLSTRLFPLLKIPGIFGEPMAQIVYDLLELSWYAEWIKGNTGYKEFNEETEDYFNTEVLHVEYQLHTDRYTMTGQVKGDNSIEGCTRLALLLFHNSAIWNFYPMIGQLLPKPIQALRIALEATIPSGLFALCRDLLLWQLFMGAACSLTLPSERAFFVSELANAARLQGIHSWQEARSILLGFFYVDRIHLPMLRQIWDECQLLVESPV
ncbi:transcriptional regulator family: Fungal Specific TF [Penicillium roqueforti]|nr:transcriptional regulator family: Fungal Specific TF [Penicillium roqueforti]KAI3181377.1 transcriptional regulator family: Fungal Specific TF [Penicillium roqueforti]